MSKSKSSEERFGAKDMYRAFKNNGTDVTYAYYRSVLESFNGLLAEELLDGATFNMGQPWYVKD